MVIETTKLVTCDERPSSPFEGMESAIGIKFGYMKFQAEQCG